MARPCPYCARPWDEGASVCRGCGAELIVGATPLEQFFAVKAGAVVGLILYVVALFRLDGLVPLGLWWFLDSLAIGGACGSFVSAYASRSKSRIFRTGGRY